MFLKLFLSYNYFRYHLILSLSLDTDVPQFEWKIELFWCRFYFYHSFLLAIGRLCDYINILLSILWNHV